MKKIASALNSPARPLLGRCLLLLILTVSGIGLLNVGGCGSDPAEVEFPTPPPVLHSLWSMAGTFSWARPLEKWG